MFSSLNEKSDRKKKTFVWPQTQFHCMNVMAESQCKKETDDDTVRNRGKKEKETQLPKSMNKRTLYRSRGRKSHCMQPCAVKFVL